MDLKLKQIVDEILREMLLELDDNFDKSVGSFAYDILKPPAEQFANLRGQIHEVDRKRDIFNLEGEELEKFIFQFTPVKRHDATKSTGVVKITGKAKTYVPLGTMVASLSQTYVTLKEGALDNSGVGYFEIESVESGKIGNADIGEVNLFPVTINGLETVYNEEPIVNGFDEEDDNSLRDRYFNYINLPATSGNRYHYLYWAKEITGVGLVRVKSLWDGDNTVKLIVTDSNGEPASEKLLNELQEYIDPKGEFIDEEKGWTKWGRGFGEAPVGAFCTIVSAEPLKIKIEADVKLNPSYTIEEVTNEFKIKMADRFSTIALDEDYNMISLAKVGCMILGLEGVADYDASSLKLNGKQQNIELTDEQVGVFEEVVFNEI